MLLQLLQVFASGVLKCFTASTVTLLLRLLLAPLFYYSLLFFVIATITSTLTTYYSYHFIITALLCDYCHAPVLQCSPLLACPPR